MGGLYKPQQNKAQMGWGSTQCPLLVVTCPYAGLWGRTWACGPLSERSLLGEFMPHSLMGNGCQGCPWGWGRSELAWFFSLRRQCRVGWMNLGGPPKRWAGLWTDRRGGGERAQRGLAPLTTYQLCTSFILWSQEPICEMGLLCLPTPGSLKVKWKGVCRWSACMNNYTNRSSELFSRRVREGWGKGPIAACLSQRKGKAWDAPGGEQVPEGWLGRPSARCDVD